MIRMRRCTQSCRNQRHNPMNCNQQAADLTAAAAACRPNTSSLLLQQALDLVLQAP
jgi:hypothetical protein